MIVVDTSALMAVLLHEASGAACRDILTAKSDFVMSAGTRIEYATVTSRNPDLWIDGRALLAEIPLRIMPVSATFALEAGDHYLRWGRGHHPAALNMGDIYAYTLAKQLNAPILFVGNDFSQTDIVAALP